MRKLLRLVVHNLNLEKSMTLKLFAIIIFNKETQFISNIQIDLNVRGIYV